MGFCDRTSNLIKVSPGICQLNSSVGSESAQYESVSRWHNKGELQRFREKLETGR